MLQNLQNSIFAVGKNTPGGVVLLGTSFGVNKNMFATAAHVVGVENKDLVLIINSMKTFNGYQEANNPEVQTVPAAVVEYDPIKDIAILQAGAVNMSLAYQLSGSDSASNGCRVYTLGFPHLDHGRMVLTAQHSRIGARIILNSQGINTKQIILNSQARPGQSGAPVFLEGTDQVAGMILGSYAPTTVGGISLGGIDPQTLHQTTHAISSEYIKDMI